VKIPYHTASGDTITRWRKSAGPVFSWAKGVTPKRDAAFYKGEDIQHARGAGIWLVEGEHDAFNIKVYGGNYAVGLPGANMLSDEHLDRLADVAWIYVPIDSASDGSSDTGGARLLDALARSSVADKVRIVRLPGAKDAGEFYELDPATFPTRLAEALSRAVTIEQRLQEDRAVQAKIDFEAAGDLPRNENLGEALLNDIQADGAIGESGIAAATALTIVSSWAGHTSSLFVKGTSGGGKSFMTERTIERFPEEHVVTLTNASEKAVIYRPVGSLEHVCLHIREATALEDRKGEPTGLALAVRSLQSEGCIDYDTVMIGDHGPETVHIHLDGPTSVIVTTTATEIHPENETRALSMRIDDSREQTGRVMAVVAEKAAGLVDPVPTDQWHAYLRYLRATFMGAEIVVPFAPALVELIAPVAVRLRRDVTTLLNFVRAHALLHARVRERDERGRILATLADYEFVHKYLGDAFSENVGATLSDDERETVKAVEAIIARKVAEHEGGLIEAYATFVELGKEIGIDRRPAALRTKKLIEGGWLVNAESRHRQPARLVIGEPLPETQTHLLPSPDALADKLRAEQTTNRSGTELVQRGHGEAPFSTGVGMP
jgi:hypothetical protein